MEKALPLMKMGKQNREAVQAGKDKWISAQVEHEHIASTLNDLEDTDYSLFQILDGNIWVRMILKKKDTNGNKSPRAVSAPNK